jgi:hypothetical protein
MPDAQAAAHAAACVRFLGAQAEACSPWDYFFRLAL